MASSTDGAVRVWNTRTDELQTEFLAPKRVCLAQAVLDARNLVAAGFDDHYLRFYSLNDNSVVGNTKLEAVPAALLPVPKHLALLCGLANGQVYLVLLE